MWFDFPHPFKPGDILWLPNDLEHIGTEPMVLNYTSIHDGNGEQTANSLRDTGSAWNMRLEGYTVEPQTGKVIPFEYPYDVQTYMDLERYPFPLAGKYEGLRQLGELLGLSP